ncbi:hypothetical protein PuT2_14765 [Pusillimonas sp. T2]|uniref:hypothetical protein n=1 Tax=Pusillimonas sp. T2 TaxID=1548123 RepID=UPI000B8B4230|nr:hypothetical protein [Pusillimonas sp. T2]OXR48057.1 hypothetical protein PuT2_14765 [Pusillimonas sp. T2]
MNDDLSVLRYKALELAAGQMLSNEDAFSAYQSLRNCVDMCHAQGRVGCWADVALVLPWQPHEHQLPEDVLDLIEERADTIEQTFRQVLLLAKEGIVQETIAGRLDSDMNTLDMAYLVQIGVQSQAAEAQTEASAPARPRF